jgi:hypothetical protein
VSDNESESSVAFRSCVHLAATLAARLRADGAVVLPLGLDRLTRWSRSSCRLRRDGKRGLMATVDNLEAALRAEGALIREAQSEITLYLAKEIEAPELVNRLIALFDGPEQRAAARGRCPRRRPPCLSVAAARTPVGCARTTRTNRGVVRKINAVAARACHAPTATFRTTASVPP